MSYIEEAFRQVCLAAKPAESWYVSLMESEPYYGGPEEGGWWGNDTRVVAYQEFPSEEAAEAAAEEVRKLAADLDRDARKAYGRQCGRELAWLEQRGLDADWLPEPDGAFEYAVVVSLGLPEESQGCRHYE